MVSVEAITPLDQDTFLAVAGFFSLQDIVASLRVAQIWNNQVDGAEHLWSARCSDLWMEKVYIPQSLREMAAGRASLDALEENRLSILKSSKVSQLRKMIRALRLRVNPGTLVEKKDFVDIILAEQRRRAESGTPVQQLILKPRLLVQTGETFPKAALRLSLVDATRTAITEDELTGSVFNLRTRADGSLAQAAPFDPWWQGKGVGEARFSASGDLTFKWPKDTDGAEIDPFALLEMPPGGMGWTLECNGRAVGLTIQGQRVVQEVVSRHPKTWGWVLYSQGTVWTSWTLPSRDNEDPILKDQNLHLLPSDLSKDW